MIIHCKWRTKAAYSYVGQTFGMRTMEYAPRISPCVVRKASRIRRLIRLRCTLFPCLLPMEIPILILSDGRYIIVREGEKARFPFWKSRSKSACFFNRKYFIFLSNDRFFPLKYFRYKNGKSSPLYKGKEVFFFIDCVAINGCSRRRTAERTDKRTFRVRKSSRGHFYIHSV